MANKVVITTSRLNSYGSRVLTEGVDLAQYRKNPVLLYMHRRGDVVGHVENVAVEGDRVVGELVFDCVTGLSAQLKSQWDAGSLNMVSAGLEIVELSEAVETVVPGQTRSTVSKSKLVEVSVVDIGANDDALRLSRDGHWLELGAGMDQALPLLGAREDDDDNNDNNNQKKKEMELEKIVRLLGMDAGSDEAAVEQRLGELVKGDAELRGLRDENEALRLSRVEMMVDNAIGERRVGQEKKGYWVELGKKLGHEELGRLLGELRPAVKLGELLKGGDGGGREWHKLSEVPAVELERLRREDLAEYGRLYEAEYGMKCEI